MTLRTKKTGIDNLGKVPPQAIDLEQDVLGAILLEKDVLDLIMPVLPNSDAFYMEQNKEVYNACLNLQKEGKPIDMRLVAEELKRMGRLEIVGGTFRLAELTSRVSSAANAEFHARVIQEKYFRRQLIKLAGETMHDSYEDTEDIFSVIDSIDQSLFEIQKTQASNTIQTPIQNWHYLIDDVEARRKLKDEKTLSGIPSGFMSVDKITQGWQPTDLIVIAARPGMGKTALVIAAARNAAVDFEVPVAVFSLEMSRIQLLHRMASSELEIDLSSIRAGSLSDSDFMKMVGEAKLHKAPIFIDDTASLSIHDIRSRTRRMVKEQGVKIVIIDYLQLITGDRSQYKGNREQEISQITRLLKTMAKELNIPVIALSQLSRSVEQRGGDKKPLLSDLRESGSIEQDADFVGFIYRPEYYGIMQDDEGNSLEGVGQLIIAKHRNGSTGVSFLRFKKRYAKFTDYEQPNESHYANNFTETKPPF